MYRMYVQVFATKTEDSQSHNSDSRNSSSAESPRLVWSNRKRRISGLKWIFRLLLGYLDDRNLKFSSRQLISRESKNIDNETDDCQHSRLSRDKIQ